MFFLREWRTAVTEKDGLIQCIVITLLCTALLNRLVNTEAMGSPWLWFIQIPAAASIALDAVFCALAVIGVALAERKTNSVN